MTGEREAAALLRPAAKAVVVVDGKLLVTRNRTPGDPGPDWYIFPGGGQRPGETLGETLRREVLEETGFEVAARRLLWVRELIVARLQDWVLDPADLHAVEFMFAAEVVADHGGGHLADTYQMATEWITPGELADLRFYPQAVVPHLLSFVRGDDPGPVYLGDVD